MQSSAGQRKSFFRAVERVNTQNHPLEEVSSLLSILQNPPAGYLQASLAFHMLELPVLTPVRFEMPSLSNYFLQLQASIAEEVAKHNAEFNMSLRSLHPPLITEDVLRIHIPQELSNILRNSPSFYQRNTPHRYEYGNPDFFRWWTRAETQSRYQQLFAQEVALRREDLNASKLEEYTNLTVPDEFICPLSGEVMTTPVYDPNFPANPRCDVLVMKTWLDEHGTNPFNRHILLTQDLVCDEILKEQIDNFVRTAWEKALQIT